MATAPTFSEVLHDLRQGKRRGNDEWPTHKILLQLAAEHADDSPLTMAAERWLAEDHCDWLRLQRVPRLPHAQKSPCLAVFEGHTNHVRGALVLTRNRLLSWTSWGLRLWDRTTGACLAVLEGHTDCVRGALILSDGRLVSWGGDNTLRVWNSRTGACLATLNGHTQPVFCVIPLGDEQFLSWSKDGTVRLWDGQTDTRLALLPLDQVPRLNPDWLHMLAHAAIPDGVVQDFFLLNSFDSLHAGQLRHRTSAATIASWNADSDVKARCLQSDGTAVLTQNTQVCVLKLHHGQRRISLAEAEELLRSEGRIKRDEG